MELRKQLSYCNQPEGNVLVMQLTSGSFHRRRDLHDFFGGQRQGGISTPSGSEFILLFTGEAGNQHGYTDGWKDDAFMYFGEGQKGDMPWVRGNAAIRDHAAAHKTLLLFEMLEKPRAHVKYIGEFAASGWEYQRCPDTENKMRKGIVFHLIPLAQPIEPPVPDTLDLDTLRNLALSAGNISPMQQVSSALRQYIQRSVAVRSYAQARAAGKCELCEQAAPFNTAAGTPYLEVHHIERLSDGGPDTIYGVAALCPNCHRAAHFAADARMINTKLRGKIKIIEASKFNADV